VRTAKRWVVMGGPKRSTTQVDNQGDQLTNSDGMDLCYPGQEADHYASTEYFFKNFFERLRKAYDGPSSVSERVKREVGDRQDENGLHWTHKNQLWIPEDDDLRKECIESVHVHPYAGHFGVERTLKKAQEVFYWPQMEESIRHYVSHCESCQKVKASKQKKLGELHPLEIPDRRWESVSMDLITDLPKTENGMDTIVVFVDRLSKMVHLAATTKTIGGVGLAKLYQRYVLSLHGFPKNIVSDRDVRFNGFWAALHEMNGVKLCNSTAKHPQTDGQMEC
jgi:hypothetical protein